MGRIDADLSYAGRGASGLHSHAERGNEKHSPSSLWGEVRGEGFGSPTGN